MEVPKLTTRQDVPQGQRTKRICLVTGAAGFVGKGLVDRLASQGKFDVIRALDIVKPVAADPRVESVKGNILDPNGLYQHLEGVETVYHLASLIDLREEAHHQHQLRVVNVIGTQNVINACVRRGVQKLVYLSSAAAYFKGAGPVLTEENDATIVPRSLLSTYAKTKQ